jgi:hypothetical protein
MMFAGKENTPGSNTHSTGSAATFFPPTVQRSPHDKDLPGEVPDAPAGQFVTPDSRGIMHNKDRKISLDVHIDFLPSHTHLHVFIAKEAGGGYKQGAPLRIIGEPGKGGNYTVVLSPVPVNDHFFIRFEARSDTTRINVPGVKGEYTISLD